MPSVLPSSGSAWIRVLAGPLQRVTGRAVRGSLALLGVAQGVGSVRVWMSGIGGRPKSASGPPCPLVLAYLGILSAESAQRKRTR